MADKESVYLCGVYETRVVLGRVSDLNKKRAEQLVERLQGPEGEQLDKWQSGTRAELLATFPDLLGDWSFDDADEAYRRNPLHQVQFDRVDG